MFLHALELSPRFFTNERRVRLKRVIALRLEGCQHLLRALKQPDDEAFKAYEETESRAAEAIQAINQLKRKQAVRPRSRRSAVRRGTPRRSGRRSGG